MIKKDKEEILLKLTVFLSPIQSFVITNIIKGLIPFNVLMLFLIIKKFLLLNKKFIVKLLIFIFIFLGYFFIQQFFNLIFDNFNKYFHNLIFISQESFNYLEFRKSFFTQSAYLIVCVSFFIILLDYMKKFGNKTIINIAFISMWFFILYGYYEFFYYFIFHSDPDFISNRITGKDFHYGLFQTITIGGFHIMRIKSLSGEPSMFAYTLLPFFILSIHLKRYKFTFVSFVTLLITTSTTAILGILIYIFFNLVFEKNRFLKLILLTIILISLILIFWDFFYSLYLFTEAKLTLQNISGIQRFNNFYNHFNAWLNSDIFHILFGYGWGYVRSTDGLTTLLFNVGIIGLIIFSLFLIFPYFLIKLKNEYIKGLFIANFTLLIVILISVPEFYYPHVWFFSALLWHEYLKEKNVRRYHKRFKNS